MTSAVFYGPIETVINGHKYSIQSDDDLFFVTMKDFFNDGVMVPIHDALNINKVPEYPEERQVIAFIKNKLKEVAKASAKKDLVQIESIGLGEYLGKTDYSFQIDARLKRVFVILKGKGVKIGPFINAAIMEKLERDGLLTQED